jgi:hypothetical protein
MFYKEKWCELKTGKTLKILFEGKFATLHGVSWFGNGNKYRWVTPGYSIIFNTNKTFTLYWWNPADSNPNALGTSTLTYDDTSTSRLRIEHSDTGVINIYVNDVLFLTVTDTKFNSGSFGLVYLSSGTVKTSEIYKAEYFHV